uniref:NADH-ubiquinone oxidoreductase chain 1 n=1 Tax=Reticunassa festiva TaxID=1052094 RepID=A0A2S0BDZ1_9CAEN|nr:NADH dehydrogenase subunit 1 [Reticunassa festiva]AND76333.1 NADH dehydrogenase subunit 1 [Reticunassa festiva]AWH01861.1 NADH dehydrogenase subunit 1 [Reticunassa festiva]UBD06950.1 NADH dehydrogenase subunit 1 [Reticunassa festiva]UBD06963.1 NADH dehydrogenase subunit 1 [Reticunassa festiva]
MYISIISTVFAYICILLAVAFFTLLERKGLSYIQIRKGPNKVGFMGLPQPLADAAKLLTKEIAKPTMANYSPYFLAPIFSFILALLLWQLYPSLYSCSYFKWGILFFLCVSGMNVYGTLLAGWASNSKYALLGSLRAIAQTISYEVSMALILLFPLFLVGSFSFIEIKESQEYIWLSFLMIPVSLMWFVTCIAETNRAPFDFAEGESELVSGFNIEYGAAGFALIFLAEYANILVMSLFSALLFFGGSSMILFESDVAFMLKVLFFAFAFIWVRGSYPRFRYDLLMGLTWKGFLPAALSFLLLVAMLSSYIFY